MTDAKRRPCEQMQNPQPRAIAEALVNLNQIHRGVSNTLPQSRSKPPLSSLRVAHAHDIEFGRGAVLDLGIRLLAWPPRLDILRQTSNHTRPPSLDSHSYAHASPTVESST